MLIGSPQRKGISGGQRKRVNLAMELLTDPAVLFLDEPTSGLSSEDAALTVMKLLRRLADEGKTILLTIHQPSLEAYRLLDNLILISKDTGSKEPGRLAYYGPAYRQAVEFFNPQLASTTGDLSPDDVLRGLGKEKSDVWVTALCPVTAEEAICRRSCRPARRRLENQGRPESSPRHGHRAMVDSGASRLDIKIKDVANTAILMAQAPIIAMLVVLVFGPETAAKVTHENWESVAKATSTTIFLLRWPRSGSAARIRPAKSSANGRSTTASGW